MPPEAGQAAHFRALESLYRSAPVNGLFRSEIEIVEPMGSDTLAWTKIAGHSVTFRCNSDVVIETGQKIGQIGPSVGVDDADDSAARQRITGIGEAAQVLDLMHVESWNEVIELVREAAARTPPGEWRLAVACAVTRVENRGRMALKPTVFTLAMLSAIMPRAWLCANSPVTPDRIAPKILISNYLCGALSVTVFARFCRASV